jgi:hypothetical protein
MPHAFLLQDWITLQGVAADVTLQSQSDWLDLSQYADVVFYATIKSVAGTSFQMVYETSPTADSDYFVTMVRMGLFAAAAPVVSPVLSGSTASLARWVRWRLDSSATAWNVTMRIWVTANPQAVELA